MANSSSITLPDVTVTAPAPSQTASGPSSLYTVKEIDVTFQLGQGSFGTSGSNTITYTGLRVLAHVQCVLNNQVTAGGQSAILRIYGLPLDAMNQLTIGGTLYVTRNNLVAISAGDAGGQKTVVFNGLINEAFPEFTEAPNSAFTVTASTGRSIAMKPTTPLSFTGPTSASTAFGQMAQNANLNLENNGVNATLYSPYFQGTTMQQIAQCAKHVDCNAYIDQPTNTLAIIPKNGNRGGDIPVISADTGMIGYPMFESVMVVVRSIYNNAVKFNGLIDIESNVVIAANGQWKVVWLEYHLSSQIPAGPWEMLIKAVSTTTGNL
jgi:hypothetical protein